MRRNPGVTGDGWQLRRFDPIDPASATAICLAEGEKDAAILAAAGLIAFTAPRGAQSLPLADFTELVDLAQATGLPVLLCGDRDEVGREAMRKVRRLLKIDLHLDAIDITSLAPENGGSVADLPAEDFLSLIRVNLLDRDPRWQKPIRSRAQYLEYKCPRPKRNIKKAGDLSGIASGKVHAATRLPAESAPPGKATFTSNDVGKESQHRCSGSRASVRLAQPLLRRSVRPRLTEGTWKTD